MLFTIVKDGDNGPEIRGLLYLGEKIPSGMEETSSSVPTLNILGTFTKEEYSELEDALASRVTFVHSDNPSIRAAIPKLGYKLFRCRDMDTGRPA